MLTTSLLTLLALIALSGNSVLARLALAGSDLDAAGFTAIRLLSGALCLALIIGLRRSPSTQRIRGSWSSALALFVYALTFSYAYLSLATGTGALILFGFVQLTMILIGWLTGQRLSIQEGLGMLLAFAGLTYLMLPRTGTPSLTGFVLMAIAGIAWGIYTLRGRGSQDAVADTAWNFIRTVPMTAALLLATLSALQWDTYGALMAMLSGALTSGLGYALWYTVLRSLTMTQAAVLQLSVPLLAAFGGILFAAEPITQTFMIASALILGGIGLVTRARQSR